MRSTHKLFRGLFQIRVTYGKPTIININYKYIKHGNDIQKHMAICTKLSFYFLTFCLKKKKEL